MPFLPPATQSINLMESSSDHWHCYYFGVCLEGFLFGAISLLQLPRPLLKQSKIPPPSFPGLYSGIFALYIQCHASRDTVKENKILFYVLCFLYVLSIATISVEMAYTLMNTGFLAELTLDYYPAGVSIVHLFLIKNFLVALITGWAGLHLHCSIHIIRLLRFHRPVHPSMRNLSCCIIHFMYLNL